MIRWFLGLPFKLLFSLLRLVSVSQRRRILSGEEAAKKYITELEKEHGSRHVPIYAQSYKRAVERVKQDLRFLMVVVTSEVHDETPAFKALLCDDNLRSYVLDNDILVWAGNVAELEAYRVSSSLGASRYPFIGVVVYNTLRESTMTCVASLEGVPTAIELMTHLQTLIDKYGPTLISLKADRLEQTYSREIRAEQDSAYEISLRKDREKAEIKKQEEALQKQLQEQERLRTANMTKWRQWKQNTLLPEPKDNKNVARISFRMPNGSRCIRKFAADILISDVYAWVDLELHPPAEANTSILEAPTNYKHDYDFTIAVPMPRKELSATTTETVSYCKEIYPSGSLIVEMNDE